MAFLWHLVYGQILKIELPGSFRTPQPNLTQTTRNAVFPPSKNCSFFTRKYYAGVLKKNLENISFAKLLCSVVFNLFTKTL